MSIKDAPALHAVRCEGGRVQHGPDGKLHALLDGPGPCRVELSDGRTREIRVDSMDLPEPVALDGPWTLTALPGQGVGLATPVKVELDKLVSWRAIPDLRTFAGIASYQAELDLPPAAFREDVLLMLELGEVYELADVWLNGRHAGTSWFPPHRLDITGHARPGKNSLLIDVPNILENHLEPGDCSRPSGLLGPARIRPAGRIILEESTP
jgi:hypothetical protein